MKRKAYLDIALVVGMLILASSYFHNPGGESTRDAYPEAILRVAAIDRLTGSRHSQ